MPNLQYSLPACWDPDRLAPLDGLPWLVAQFPTAAARATRMLAEVERLVTHDEIVERTRDCVNAVCRFARKLEKKASCDSLLADTGQAYRDETPYEQVRKTHASVLASCALSPSTTKRACGLVLCVLRAWLLEPDLSPLAAVSRDLCWARIPAELVDLSVEAALFSIDLGRAAETGLLEASIRSSLDLIPSHSTRRVELLEHLADLAARPHIRTSDVRDIEAEIILLTDGRCVRTSQVRDIEAEIMALADGRCLANAMLRAALRRYAVERVDGAVVWAQRASVELLESNAVGAGDLREAIDVLHRQCRAQSLLKLPLADECKPKRRRNESEERRRALLEAQTHLGRVVPELIECLGDEDVAAVRRGLEDWCEASEQVVALPWAPAIGTVALVIWVRGALAELAELEDDDARWKEHKRTQLELEDRFGIALGECAVTPDTGARACELVVEAPSAKARARQCIAEANACIAAGNRERASFWLARAEHYRREMSPRPRAPIPQ